MRGTQTETLKTFRKNIADASFYCRARRREVDMGACINDFVSANAFENRRSACFRCHQGRKVREDFAASN
ncbi:MAG TPA: hypothetical protein PLY68_07015 [Myxococcota bacterium]|nr:hypothetical protein [Myxococcota bacterium]HOD08110.1 hypothetical protein [Myxococcota bacterium]HPB51103.1 hypothetical protein [Myxococcota bacterium]HQP95932.1 hypothetical protein [Myxococcota bacterium]